MPPAAPDFSGSTTSTTDTTRDIGEQLALADRGCDVVSTGKTTDDSELPGSIERTVHEVRRRGVKALANPFEPTDAMGRDLADEVTEESRPRQ
ncbi:hypothetical protein [Halorubrum sp. Atlit-26R]|uniref:hypothetical protein n=1 Tax=Halorubrum sp. Atlit-26R TaxID=2282128 RepID=UPI0026C60354